MNYLKTWLMLPNILSYIVYLRTDPVSDLQRLLEETNQDDEYENLNVINNVTSGRSSLNLPSRRRRTRSIDVTDESFTVRNPENDDEFRLVQFLFQSYNREVRPVIHKKDVVNVVFGIAFTQLVDLDEKNQILISNAWVRMRWYNQLLTWNKDDFGGIESINVDPKMIWLPDIVLQNNAEETLGSGQMDQFKTKVIVHYTGKNSWYAPTILRSRCGINVEYFPFDDQKCDLKFLSWTYDGFRVNITNSGSSADLKFYTPSGEFKLISAKAKREIQYYTCCPEPYPEVTFTIHIRRKTLFYFNNLIVPCFLITALGLLTFVLPPATGERVTLVITTLLAMTVFMLMIAEKTPTTSKATPLIGKFFIASMVIIGLSLIATCVVLNLYECTRAIDSVPRFIRILMLDYLAPILHVDPPRQRAIPPPVILVSDDEDEDDDNDGQSHRGPMRHRRDSWNFHKTNNSASVNFSDAKIRSVPTLPKELVQGVAILSERARQLDEHETITEEWQAVAKVSDRLFLILFLTIVAVTTIYIFVNRPEPPE